MNSFLGQKLLFQFCKNCFALDKFDSFTQGYIVVSPISQTQVCSVYNFSHYWKY